jgi:hypothetical protein
MNPPIQIKRIKQNKDGDLGQCEEMTIIPCSKLFFKEKDKFLLLAIQFTHFISLIIVFYCFGGRLVKTTDGEWFLFQKIPIEIGTQFFIFETKLTFFPEID